MSNVNQVQGAAYPSSVVEMRSAAFAENQGTGFSNAMGQAAVLTPSVAQNLMYRSMTTGVPNAEMEQYGGYSAVKAMFDAGGGSYSLDAIPAAQRQQLAQQVASTGVGNMSLLVSEHMSLSPSAAAAGLTPSMAQSLMQRSMTTGVPKSEMDLYGGYDAVKAAYDAASGSYSTDAIPAQQKQQLAMQVAATGVGNFALPAANQVSVGPAAIQAMKDNGIDLGTIDSITKPLAQAAIQAAPIPAAPVPTAAAPFVDSSSYIDAFMGSLSASS